MRFFVNAARAALVLVVATAAASPGVLAQGFPTTFADVVEEVLPAVVEVQVRASTFEGEGDPEPPTSLFEFFERQQGGPQRPRGGAGSGFFIDVEGYLVTNEHVVAAGDLYSVVLSDGQEIEADLLGVDEATDLALLKIDPEGLNLTAVEWADSDAIRVGDWVLAVGNPLNVGITVTHGIVSAVNRDVQEGNPFDQSIQTDAAINSGNSGGPSFNLDGKVIGVNQLIRTPTGGSVGLGFMIPSNLARDIIGQIREGGEVQRGFLGLEPRVLSDEMRELLGLEDLNGVLINKVFAGLPADTAGLMAGDLITDVQGQAITDPESLIQIVSSYSPGTTIAIEIVRQGEVKLIEVALVKRGEESIAALETDGERLLAEDYGVRARTLGLDDLLQQGLQDMIGGAQLIAMAPRSPFAAAGLRPGDVVLEVDDTSIAGVDDLYQVLEARIDEGLEAVRLIFLREGEMNVREMELPIRE